MVGTNGAWIKSIFHTSEHMKTFLIENPFRRCDDVCLVQQGVVKSDSNQTLDPKPLIFQNVTPGTEAKIFVFYD